MAYQVKETKKKKTVDDFSINRVADILSPFLDAFVPKSSRKKDSSLPRSPSSSSDSLPPILLLHGFDSSAFEFRRLAPLLAKKRDVYAIDILGNN